MKITTIMILLFLLLAFTVGISVQDNDVSIVNNAIDNATSVINNVSLTYIDTNSSIPNMQGFYLILEKYIHFVGTFALEIMRAGIIFGHENPEFFETSFLIYTMKLIIILLILSLAIQPAFYLLVFLVMVGIYVKDFIIKRRKKKKDAQPTI